MSWNRTAGGKALVIVLALAGVFGAVAGTAVATPPGKNGKIVFRRYTNAEQTAGALFVARPDGSGVRQLTHPASGRVIDNEPDWSPGGTQVVFQRADENACGDDSCETDQIWVVNADGSSPHAIATDSPGTSCAANDKPAGGVCRFSPAWSPDGAQVIFACTTPFIPGYPATGGLCIIGADGTGLRTLERTPARWYDDGPQFSPDGKRIAFERDYDSADGSTLKAAVFVMNADGSSIRRLTPWALRAGDHPDWSPDGKRILFTSNVDGPAAVSANKYMIKADGTGLRQLTHATGGAVQYMSSSYSPDGKWITLARRTRNGNPDVYVMKTDGTRLRNVTRSSAWDSAPDWGAGTA